jgi:hypothetical protein
MAVAGLLAAGALVAGQGPALADEGSWRATGSLNVPRLQPTSTLLGNGKVLVAGGRNFAFTQALASAELYDPITEAFTLTGPMTDARWSHTATLLPNGKVLVAGGFTNPSTSANAQPVLASAELYDPATGGWTLTGSMSTRRALHVAQLLPDGRVLVAGGRTCNGPPPLACNSTFTTNTAEIYDPATGVWTPTTSMASNRTTTSAALLPNGSVLVAAGFPGGQNTAEAYAGSTGAWSPTGNLNVARARQGAMMLPDGTVLVAAGSTGTSTLTSETYNPATNTWTLAGNVAQARFNYFFAELPNRHVLIAGGAGGATASTTAEVYDPAGRTWSSAGTLANAHGSSSSNGNSTRAVVLSASPTAFVFDPRVCGTNCGKVLVVGDNPNGAADLYTPGTVSLATCTTTVTGPSGSVTVPAGSVTCVTGAQVTGSITVQPGGALVLTNSMVTGGVQSTGAAGVRICGSQIRRPATGGPAVAVTGSFGPVVVGDGSPGCARNDIAGAATFDANQSVRVDTNRVNGDLSVTFTAGGASGAVIAANQVTGGLACAGNTPPPADAGRPNTVLGARSGQCAAAGF